jgi:hypothetical protein
MLQNHGQKLKIIVFRNNQPLLLELKVGSILK